MSNTKKLKKTTELRQLRESYSISVKELCAELEVSEMMYTAHESGFRQYKGEKYDNFLIRVEDALNVITKRKIEQSKKSEPKKVEKKLNGVKINNLIYQGKTLADIYGEDIVNILEEDDDEQDDDIFPPVNIWVLEQAKELIEKGNSLVKTSIILGVSDLDLEKKLTKEQQKYQEMQELINAGKTPEELFVYFNVGSKEEFEYNINFYNKYFNEK